MAARFLAGGARRPAGGLSARGNLCYTVFLESDQDDARAPPQRSGEAMAKEPRQGLSLGGNMLWNSVGSFF